MRNAPPSAIVSRGGGPATALIHGALSSNNFWPHPLPRRVLSGRTHAYALPAHHPWDMPRGELLRLLNMRDLADAYALALRRDFDERPVHLIGHSTGAFVAMAVAARHPRRVSRLTLIGGFADGNQTGGSSIINSMLRTQGYVDYALVSLFQMWTSTKMTFDAGLATVMGTKHQAWSNAHFCRSTEQVRLDLLQSDATNLLDVGRWLKRQKLTELLPHVQQPTLVVAGRDDPVVPFSHQRLMASTMPRGRLAAFSDVGHIANIERPTQFCSAVDSSFQY